VVFICVLCTLRTHPAHANLILDSLQPVSTQYVVRGVPLPSQSTATVSGGGIGGFTPPWPQSFEFRTPVATLITVPYLSPQTPFVFYVAGTSIESINVL
jgi:hypothetical protein